MRIGRLQHLPTRASSIAPGDNQIEGKLEIVGKGSEKYGADRQGLKTETGPSVLGLAPWEVGVEEGGLRLGRLSLVQGRVRRRGDTEFIHQSGGFNMRSSHMPLSTRNQLVHREATR